MVKSDERRLAQLDCAGLDLGFQHGVQLTQTVVSNLVAETLADVAGGRCSGE